MLYATLLQNWPASDHPGAYKRMPHPFLAQKTFVILREKGGQINSFAWGGLLVCLIESTGVNRKDMTETDTCMFKESTPVLHVPVQCCVFMNLLSVAGVLVVCTPAARASWVVCGSRRSCSPHSSWRDSLRILRMDLADWTELPDSSVGETFFTTLDGRGEDGVAPDGMFHWMCKVSSE